MIRFDPRSCIRFNSWREREFISPCRYFSQRSLVSLSASSFFSIVFEYVFPSHQLTN